MTPKVLPSPHPMASPRKLTIHLSSELALEIERRVTDARGPSATGAQAIARYAAICASTDHGLTDGEVSRLAELLVGWDFSAPIVGLLHEVVPTAAKQAKKRIAPELLTKLRDMGLGERIALVDAIERRQRT